ncbi:M24 family metallopeptidase [Bradyrhizobium sp. Pear76]|nr:M24 family metallopeptidase [Bradyrhizobium oropedii]
MRVQGAHLTAIGPGSHMDWLLGFHPYPDERPCLLLVAPEKETILMPVLNAEGSRGKTDIEFHAWGDADGPNVALAQAISAIGATEAKSVILDETMRADFALLLLDALTGAKHSFTDDTLGSLRMRKDAAEFSTMKMNARIADRVMQKAFAAIRLGISEAELASAIQRGFSEEGAAPEFWIVACGSNSAVPHPQSGRNLGVGDAVLIDIGGRKNGFPSDITRMAVVGHPPDGYDEIHTIVEEAVQSALMAARAGVSAKDLDAAARGVITNAGYGEFFMHRTGHGMGIDLHEPPYITATSETVLEEGMVFSIEPGIYLPGRFGIRLEEIVILREDGPEILSTLPRDVYLARG